MVEVKDFFDRKFTYVVVGASNNPEKYGYKIVETLKNSGFKVIPVNPKEKEILGLKVYGSLEEIDVKIDIVDFLVPASITLRILENVKNLKIQKVWFQPGSYDNKCESYCRKNRIKYIKDFCLMKTVLDKF